jgi:hypothetical protein
MSHAFVKNHIHLVFSTKDRQPSISKDVQPELWSYLAGICRNQKMAPIAINGHVGSRAYSFSPAANHCAGQGRSTSQIQLFQMDERTWTALRLAGWICRIQRECLEYCNRGEICPRSATASPQDDVRAGVSGAAEETRHRSRCLITARVCRPAKAGLELSSHRTHRLPAPANQKRVCRGPRSRWAQ